MLNHEVWIVLDTSQMGGIESHVIQLAELLHHNGHFTRVIRLENHGEHPLIRKLDQAHIDHVTSTGRFIDFLRTVKVGRPKVLHSHGYKAGLWCRLASKMARIPVIHTHHAGEAVAGKVALYQFLDRYTSFVNRWNISVSDKIQQALPCQSIKLNNFVEQSGMHLSQGNQIAFVGRLSEEKGADHFLELAHRLSNETFHVYGDGPCRRSLQASAGNNVVFYGHAEMNMHWDNIGVLVVSSRYEGMPMAVLEAMARGICVVSFDVGDIPNLIVDGHNGFLAKSGLIVSLEKKLRQAL